MTTTTAAYTLFQKMTKAGMDEKVANAFVEYEAERSEDVLTSKVGQIIVEQMKAMGAKRTRWRRVWPKRLTKQPLLSPGYFWQPSV